MATVEELKAELEKAIEVERVDALNVAQTALYDAQMKHEDACQSVGYWRDKVKEFGKVVRNLEGRKPRQPSDRPRAKRGACEAFVLERLSRSRGAVSWCIEELMIGGEFTAPQVKATIARLVNAGKIIDESGLYSLATADDIAASGEASCGEVGP